MHRLQQHILSELIHHPVRRYADLKPDEVEGNLFMYHLRAVISADWVEKRPDGRYELTADGLRYAETLSLKTYAPRVQPRIVTMLLVRDEAERVLLYRRERQPLIGMSGLPYGKVHLGETIAEAANRELAEKTGLSADLDHRGDGYITTYEGDELVSQLMFHLFVGNNPRGELIEHADGKAHWANLSDLSRDDILPSVNDLLKLLNSGNGRFFTELVYYLGALGSK